MSQAFQPSHNTSVICPLFLPYHELQPLSKVCAILFPGSQHQNLHICPQLLVAELFSRTQIIHAIAEETAYITKHPQLRIILQVLPGG